MALRLVEQRPAPGERMWVAFGVSDGFTTAWWCDVRWTGSGDCSVMQVIEGDTEVARVELDEDLWLGNWVGVPSLSASVLEIQFIEVHSAHQGRGIGRQTIDLLRARYPDRVLVALSEEADEFWDALGWSRHPHQDDDGIGRPSRPLYIDPKNAGAQPGTVKEGP